MAIFYELFCYILTNKTNRVLHIGVTNDLIKRVWEHKEKVLKGFTERYNVHRLVYYEIYEDPEAAIAREKQLKAGSRSKKIKLILEKNNLWEDLYQGIIK